MGGNDANFLFWVLVRAAPGLLLRIALEFWPVTLIWFACIVAFAWAVM